MKAASEKALAKDSVPQWFLAAFSQLSVMNVNDRRHKATPSEAKAPATKTVPAGTAV